MNGYEIINRFECCGKMMVSVKMKSAVCTMLEKDFAKIVRSEKWNNKNKAV